MSKQKAIEILQAYINDKKQWVSALEQVKFQSDVDEIRKRIVDFTHRDILVLQIILSQLKSSRNDTKRPTVR